MNISILGLKLNVELLTLFGVIFLILVGHTVGGCCRCGMWEGFDNKEEEKAAEKAAEELPTQEGNGDVTPGGNLIESKAKQGASKQSNKAGKEGFSGINGDLIDSSPYDISNVSPVNTSSWNNPNLTVSNGQQLTPDVKKFLDRKQQPIPLPEGELTFFANTEFKPECCPSSYSNSMGCACMTSKDYNYLIMRGGNNIPYSEY